MIFAWAGIEPGEWEDLELISTTAPKATTIGVSDGDAKAADLQLVLQRATPNDWTSFAEVTNFCSSHLAG